MKVKRILIIFIVVLVITGLAYILWLFPVKKKLIYGNCEISYDYYHRGSGYGYRIFAGSGYNYPNKFWYRNAKSELLRCICDEYIKSKDSLSKDSLTERSIIDSLISENDFIHGYLMTLDSNKYFSVIVSTIRENQLYNSSNISNDSILQLCRTDLISEDKILPFLKQKSTLMISIDSVCKYKEMIFFDIEIE